MNRLDFLIDYLIKEDTQYSELQIPETEQEKRDLFRALRNVRPPKPVSEDFLRLLDEELQQMLAEDLPDDLPHVFISAVANKGLMELKDILWLALNSESNKLQSITQQETIVHRNKDLAWLRSEMEDEGEDEEIEFIDEDEIEDLEDFEYEEDE